MARGTMTDLIRRTRRLIGDLDITDQLRVDLSGAQVFSDDDIQNALDAWRTERRFVPLRPQPTFTPGGGVIYLDYYSDATNWEADIVLQDMSYQTQTPALSEDIVGHWAFASQVAGIGMRATGKTYDLYAAAADLLDAWAALVKLDFSFKSDKDQYERAAKFDMITQLAAKYRGLAQPHAARMVQTDAAAFGGDDSNAVTYPTVAGQSGP